MQSFHLIAIGSDSKREFVVRSCYQRTCDLSLESEEGPQWSAESEEKWGIHTCILDTRQGKLGEKERKGVGWERHALYASGFQNGWWLMANRLPMIETGIVDPTIDTNKEGILRKRKTQYISLRKLDGKMGSGIPYA